MNVEPAQQLKLLELAEVDAELNRIQHRRQAMPELAKVVEAERAVRERRDRVVEAETTVGDLDRDIQRLERDVDGVRARAQRDKTMLAGAGVPAKQAADLQHELDTLGRRQSVLEDELLELMERREAAQTNLDATKAELSSADRNLAEAVARRDEAAADLDTAEAGRLRAREPLVAELPAELLAVYEAGRAKRGVGAAPLRARRCGACRLELDRLELSRVKSASPQTVLRHEECGVIMVRTAESGL